MVYQVCKTDSNTFLLSRSLTQQISLKIAMNCGSIWGLEGGVTLSSQISSIWLKRSKIALSIGYDIIYLSADRLAKSFNPKSKKEMSRKWRSIRQPSFPSSVNGWGFFWFFLFASETFVCRFAGAL